MPRSFYAVALVVGMVTLSGFAKATDRYKPFIHAFTTPESVTETVAQVKAKLERAGLTLVGHYVLNTDSEVLVATNDMLRGLSLESRLSGFASTLRVSVNATEGGTQVSYVNPDYLQRAYRIETDLSGLAKTLEDALGREAEFGSEKGLTEKKLAKYRYTFGMEQFDDVYQLSEFPNQDEALSAVRAGLNAADSHVKALYELPLSRANTVIFGVSMSSEDEQGKYYDDQFQMSIVDFTPMKSTAYLPYQLLVIDGAVVALHMRFRMAVHFPDLKMMGKHSFMTLMPSPSAIEKALGVAVNTP